MSKQDNPYVNDQPEPNPKKTNKVPEKTTKKVKFACTLRSVRFNKDDEPAKVNTNRNSEQHDVLPETPDDESEDIVWSGWGWMRRAKGNIATSSGGAWWGFLPSRTGQ